MPFDSIAFLIFFPLAVALYFACPARHRWALLLAASYVFYAAWWPQHVGWLVVSTVMNYLLALLIARTSDVLRRKILLVFGLAVNLGVLFVFKYLGFLNGSLRELFGAFGRSYDVGLARVLLPVGISFYTFQALGYVIDVYRGKVEPEKHLGRFALFVSFFPQLVAGPIERAGHLLPQFYVEQKLDAARVADGLRRMLWGMFKKVVVADRLAVYVNAVFGQPAGHRGLPVLLATCFCAVQIYCDFSGYSDIALGAARVMGYELIDNFRQPYCAHSISDFWRRWHISLTNWFRDYLYIPLGGNRVPRWRWYLNIMIVFLISGLWHGASWTFVVWGGLHGFLYLLEVWSQGIRTRAARALRLAPGVQSAIGVAITLVLVCLAWIFFSARSISDALLLIGNLTRFGASTDVLAPWKGVVTHPELETGLALGLVVLVAIVHVLRERKPEMPSLVWRQSWFRWAVYLILALAIMNLGMAQETPFIYFQF
jgi:alginate O-acetyltransferase complex protein AlgI